MKNTLVIAAAGALLAFAPASFASDAERPSHYKGKPAETLVEAVRNFSESNAKLDAILNGEVTNVAMSEIHELTYTLENALQKIHADMGELAETLEKVHVASEKLDREAIVKHGREYLSVSRQIVK